MMDETVCFHTWLLSLDMADKNTTRQMMILIKMSTSAVISEVAHLPSVGNLCFSCLLIPIICFVREASLHILCIAEVNKFDWHTHQSII